VPSSLESARLHGAIGRENELEALSGFIAGVTDGPASLLLEGEPGIGKTTLWRAAVASARERGYCVLACRPAGGEVQLSFAALGDLLDDELPEVLIELPVPQRRALEVALLLEESRGPPPDQRAIALAFLGVLRSLAETRPVLVAVDDVQWLDRPTAGVLEFALRRLAQEPVGVLAAVRIEAGLETRADPALGPDEERRLRLRVGPLSVAAVHNLIRAQLGVALPRPLLLRVHEASGGNPFYALELARALGPAGARLQPGARLPVPETLQELVRARLAALPRPVQELLLAVACLSDPTVSSVDAVTGSGRARSNLDAAVTAGVLELDGDRIAFTHPLLAAAVDADAGAHRRREMHRRLATVVVDDPEAQARHLALGTFRRDAVVADALDRAARQASARGAPGAAAELLELAMELTPAGHDVALRRRKLEAADAHFSSGAIEQATMLLQSLVAGLPAGDERAKVLLLIARGSGDLETSLDLAAQAGREVVGDDAVRSRVQLVLGQGWPLHGIGFAIEHGRLAVRHAERSKQPRLVVEALARLALWQLWAGRSPADLLKRAVALEESTHRLQSYENPRLPLALWRMYQGRLDEARTLFDELLAEADELGHEIASLGVRGRLVDVELRAGRWQTAAAHAATAYELAEQIGLEHDSGFTLYWKALVDAHLGRVPEARSAAEAGARLARDAKHENTLGMNLGVLGFIEISLGNEAAALPHLRPLIDWLSAKDLALATHPMAPHALEALIGAGELEESRTLIARFEREARRLESSWALAIGARCRALLAAAEGDAAAACTALEGALAFEEHADWPFERARSLLVLGRIQRRAKQKAAARQSLERALEIFDGLPAPLWSERAREELRRTGLRRSAPDGLTESEQRVAELAASGLTNREVAKRLFISPKTVEANLARAYRKLGIRSRAELGAQLASGGHKPPQT